jgi:heme oxygenase
MTADGIATIPSCRDLKTLAGPAERLGARYVVEAAALGGRVIARELERLFPKGTEGGRHFFLGGGAEVRPRWRLSRARFGQELPASENIEAAASARLTFLAFEVWMQDWIGEAP